MNLEKAEVSPSEVPRKRPFLINKVGGDEWKLLIKEATKTEVLVFNYNYIKCNIERINKKYRLSLSLSYFNNESK